MEARSLYITVIAVLALPAAGLNALFQVTQDPYLQPLGITQERLAVYGGQKEFASIAVQVDWGRDRTSGTTHADLRAFIANAFAPRTGDYFIKIQEVPGTDIRITLVVGANRYGPYPPSRLIEGMVPAIVALEMTKNSGN